jgi:hypothetical protein
VGSTPSSITVVARVVIVGVGAEGELGGVAEPVAVGVERQRVRLVGAHLVEVADGVAVGVAAVQRGATLRPLVPRERIAAVEDVLLVVQAVAVAYPLPSPWGQRVLYVAVDTLLQGSRQCDKQRVVLAKTPSRRCEPGPTTISTRN